MELKDAIEIARIISKAPAERLPMILSVLEKVSITIEGLEELDEWRLREMAAIVDFEDFKKSIKEKFAKQLKDGRYIIPAVEFTEFCKEYNLNPSPTRRWLAKKGVIEINTKKGKTNYTVNQYINGKHMRCVVLDFGD